MTTHAGAILVGLIVIDLAVGLTLWLRSKRFREGWKRRTPFDDTFGLNFWTENRWYFLFSIVVLGLFFLVLSLADG